MTIRAIVTACTLGVAGAALAQGPAPTAPADGFSPMPYVILCGQAGDVAAFLRANGEEVAAKGVTAKTGGASLLAQLWVNPATRDWTVVYVDPASGIACMVAAGTEFGIDRAAPGQGRSGAI